jgi:hypothetical protein
MRIVRAILELSWEGAHRLVPLLKRLSTEQEPADCVLLRHAAAAVEAEIQTEEVFERLAAARLLHHPTVRESRP